MFFQDLFFLFYLIYRNCCAHTFKLGNSERVFYGLVVQEYKQNCSIRNTTLEHLCFFIFFLCTTNKKWVSVLGENREEGDCQEGNVEFVQKLQMIYYKLNIIYDLLPYK